MIPRKTIALTRKTGSYINGVWTPGAPVNLTIRGSLQPASSEDLEKLPEGRRNKTAYRIYTKDDIRGLDTSANPDRVQIHGDSYEVVTVAHWENGLLNHKKAVVVKL